MIVPDVNLLIYAYNRDAPHHAEARAWWEDLLSSDEPVGLTWATTLGYIRLMTHRAVLITPLPTERAITHVRSWHMRPNVSVLEPGPRHLDLLGRMLDAIGTAGRLTTDAHLAALAIEHQCELCSNDADFARFPGLRWRNPLATD
ncbi:MAG: type II toxin-antitoxin system VapC family toxin [Gammaproteobacteria bacterium]